MMNMILMLTALLAIQAAPVRPELKSETILEWKHLFLFLDTDDSGILSPDDFEVNIGAPPFMEKQIFDSKKKALLTATTYSKELSYKAFLRQMGREYSSEDIVRAALGKKSTTFIKKMVVDTFLLTNAPADKQYKFSDILAWFNDQTFRADLKRLDN